MDILKIAILGIVGTLLGIMLKDKKKEYELFVTLGVSLCIFYFIISKLELVLSVINRMQDYVRLDTKYIAILIKMIGITYVSEFSSNLCKDAGYQTVAGQIEMFGKLSILVISMPVLLVLLETIGEFFKLRQGEYKMKEKIKHYLPLLWIVICFFLIPQKICRAESIEIETVKKIENFSQEEVKSIDIKDFNQQKIIEDIGNASQEGEAYIQKNLGEEMEETLEQYLAELDFSDIDDFLVKQESTQTLNFQELVKKLSSGEEIDKKWLLEEIFHMVFAEIRTFRGTLVQIVLLCMVFAILYNFADVFENPAVTEISFYIVYMLLLVLLMQSFFILRDISTEVISEMMVFLKVLIPTFTMSMAFSGQITSAAGFYDMTFILIYGMEWVMQYLIIPSIQIYMVLELMNYLMEEELLSRMTDLLKSSVLWVMKLLFTVVIGINVVQNLLTPVIDTFKTNLISKTAGMIPGLGTSISAVTEIMVGSGIIIKNGIGLAAVLVLLVLCAGPLIKVGVMAFLYKLLAAIIQPVSGKQLIGCISSAGESSKLLGKVVVTTTVMFLVTIAMITAATTFIH